MQGSFKTFTPYLIIMVVTTTCDHHPKCQPSIYTLTFVVD